MGYNFISNVESCHIDIPQLLYYSHLPAIIISLFFGIFVFLKSNKSLAGKILLAISVLFSLWAILSLIVWITFDSRTYSFSWSFFETLSVAFYFLIPYFVYAFIEERDISFKTKALFGLLLLLVMLISPTKYYYSGFSAATCDAIENHYFLYYVYALKAISFIVLLALLAAEYSKHRRDSEARGKIAIVGTGSILLLLSFLFTQYVSNLIFDDYTIEFYGLFAIALFMGALAYAIVKFQAFNIKILGAQALVYAIIILVGSQLFFIKTWTNMVLTGITLILSGIFGSVLINSVKMEVRRKDELQYISHALAVSNERLKTADNSKNEFLSIASHQLRTPLTVIKGYIALMFDGSYGKIPENLAPVMKNIMISNDRLIELVEDLLNISRMESGRMEFKYAPTDVMDLLKELVGTFIVKANNRPEIEIRLIRPSVELPMVATDRAKLREVVSNLIDNAVKYTPKGLVTVRAWQKDPDKIRIEVTDSGIGIPASEMPYLFEKFSRGKDTSRLNAGGTGLGLHVGKSMIEAMSGRIWAESDGDKKGATFIVELPVRHEDRSPEPEIRRENAPKPEPPIGRMPKKEDGPSEGIRIAVGTGEGQASGNVPEAADPGEPEKEAAEPEKPEPSESEAPKAVEILKMDRPVGTAEPAPEGRIIFTEPRKGKRIV